MTRGIGRPSGLIAESVQPDPGSALRAASRESRDVGVGRGLAVGGALGAGGLGEQRMRRTDDESQRPTRNAGPAERTLAAGWH